MLDLVLGTVGVSCASALPSGLDWFDLAGRRTAYDGQFVTGVLIWSFCLGSVGLAFAVVGRHAIYKRAARPAEWLIIAMAVRYLSFAVTELHAETSSWSLLVAKMESGLQADLGPIGRLACTSFVFVVIAVYVGVLFKFAGLSSFLRTLLGAATALLWLWGPCDVWDREVIAVTGDWASTGGALSTQVLIPAAPLAMLPLVLAYWTICSRVPRQRWTLIDFTCMIWFVGTALMMYFHPSVQQFGGSVWFVVELMTFVIVLNLVAALLGWSVAYLYRELVEKKIATDEE